MAAYQTKPSAKSSSTSCHVLIPAFQVHRWAGFLAFWLSRLRKIRLIVSFIWGTKLDLECMFTGSDGLTFSTLAEMSLAYVNRPWSAFARLRVPSKSAAIFIFRFHYKQDVSISTLDGDFWPDSFPPPPHAPRRLAHIKYIFQIHSFVISSTT